MASVRNKKGQFVKGGKHSWRNAMLTTDLDRKLYVIWKSMVQRCRDKNCSGYRNYGGRGIAVSIDWLKYRSFSKDMKGDYRTGMTLERVNNNGDYCKENCRWATVKEQANNRRTNRFIWFKGENKTLAQWSELLGIKRTTITQRLDYYGWSVERALSIS